MTSSTLIALVAEKGAGKSHFVETTRRLLPNRRIVSMRFSDPLRSILTILNKEVTRQHMQALGTALRHSFNDDGILNEVVRKYIAEAEADIVLLDGLRKTEEAHFVRGIGGKLVYITVHPHIRFERRRQSAENADETNTTWEKFLAQEDAATEISIREIGETLAHVTIENNDSLEEFEQNIKRALMQLTP